MDGVNSYKPLNAALVNTKLTTNGATGTVEARDAKKLDKAASEFESLFINHMLKTMRESSMKNSLFDGGKGEEVYTSMLDTELSSIMSKGEGIGLKKALLSQLNAQGSTPAPTSEIKEGKLQEIKPILNNKAALKEFQSHVTDDEFVLPVAGRVSSGYGIRKDPITGEHAFHSGIDIAAPQGTPVYPASPGEVVFSGKKDGYGNLVEILHDNGYLSRYGNNNELRVRRGERVSAHDVIALVGTAEDESSPHLHFETVVEGFAVNPTDFVNFN